MDTNEKKMSVKIIYFIIVYIIIVLSVQILFSKIIDNEIVNSLLFILLLNIPITFLIGKKIKNYKRYIPIIIVGIILCIIGLILLRIDDIHNENKYYYKKYQVSKVQDNKVYVDDINDDYKVFEVNNAFIKLLKEDSMITVRYEFHNQDNYKVVFLTTIGEIIYFIGFLFINAWLLHILIKIFKLLFKSITESEDQYANIRR